MLILSEATGKQLLLVPSNPYSALWTNMVHDFYALMGAENPDWQIGATLVPNDGTDECSIQQWFANVDHMVAQGIQIKIANTKSYWFLRRTTATWAGHGENTLLELCYVGVYHDEFHGHATEYFPSLYTLDALEALKTRMRKDLTTKDSGLGYNLDAAISINHLAEITL